MWIKDGHIGTRYFVTKCWTNWIVYLTIHFVKMALSFILIGTFTASFSLFSSFRHILLTQLIVNKIADDWIRTTDL